MLNKFTSNNFTEYYCMLLIGQLPTNYYKWRRIYISLVSFLLVCKHMHTFCTIKNRFRTSSLLPNITFTSENIAGVRWNDESMRWRVGGAGKVLTGPERYGVIMLSTVVRWWQVLGRTARWWQLAVLAGRCGRRGVSAAYITAEEEWHQRDTIKMVVA